MCVVTINDQSMHFQIFQFNFFFINHHLVWLIYNELIIGLILSLCEISHTQALMILKNLIIEVYNLIINKLALL